MIRVLGFLAALLFASPSFACIGALQSGNNLSDVCDAATARTNLGVSAGNARGFSQPFNTIPTTADPDVYQIPTGSSAVIAGSTVPDALCAVSPAATVTFLVKKWTTGNPATSSTLCTGSLSTSCAVSGCSISETTLAATNGISIEATAAGADSAARVTITVPWAWQ
jgi:hypothetical protein